MYLNRIMTTVNSQIPDDEQIHANLVTQLYGYCGLPFVLISIWTISHFGRRTLLVIG